MASNTHTDPRLLVILTGGASVKRMIDPDGLTSLGPVNNIVINTGNKTWSAALAFPHETTMIVSGVTEESLVIKKVAVSNGGKEWENLPVKASKRLLDALTPLSGLPPGLREVLSNPGEKNAKNDKTEGKMLWVTNYIMVLEDALFWNIEGGEDKTRRKMFNEWRTRYLHDQAGKTTSAEFSANLKTREGKITVSAKADIYGLYGKKVTVTRNLGMGRETIAECLVTKDGKRRPSLLAAFDLDSSIPMLYTKQRKKKTGLGKPRAK